MRGKRGLWLGLLAIAGLMAGFASEVVMTPPARAETWVEYNNPDGRYRFFVDRDSIKKQGKIVWVSAYALLNRPVNMGGTQLESIKYWISVDCRARALRIRQVVLYDADKNYLDVNNLGDRGPMFRSTPDVVNRQLYSNLCR